MSEEEDIKQRLLEACNGHPHAKIPWPHRLLHDARDYIEQLETHNIILRQAFQGSEASAYVAGGLLTSPQDKGATTHYALSPVDALAQEIHRLNKRNKDLEEHNRELQYRETKAKRLAARSSDRGVFCPDHRDKVEANSCPVCALEKCRSRCDHIVNIAEDLYLSLREILDYDGGADSPLNDEFVMDRVEESLRAVHEKEPEITKCERVIGHKSHSRSSPEPIEDSEESTETEGEDSLSPEHSGLPTEILQDIRDLGWAIADHHDYYVGDEFYTRFEISNPKCSFIIFDDGKDDREALQKCWAKIVKVESWINYRNPGEG